MKKIVKILFLFLFFFIFTIPVQAKETHKIKMYFFHGDGCPHCAEEEIFLKKYENDKDVEIIRYEVWYDSDNQELLNKVASSIGIKKAGVPLTIIGDSYFIGYSDSIGKSIQRGVTYYKENGARDIVKLIKDDKFDGKLDNTFLDKERELEDQFSVDVPFIGTIYLKNVSLVTAATLIGLIDGFNPCAMWVLLFLISVLIGMKDKKRMLILGITFLVTSALVYMIIMFSWLNIVVKVSTSIFIRNIIAAFAVVGGVWNLRSYLRSRKQDGGCEVVDDKRRKKIFSRIKKFTHEKSFLLALVGVMALAVSVNLVELACSAGLPLVFTQLLAINEATGLEGFLYTLLYILFFLIDDLVVFIIAVYTMNVTGISTKYNKYSHLIGGILMLIIGIILFVKPELLMF